ncbi:MAG TPA: phage major capsid protein [Chthoniobacteraceae bacterium]|nr:phage major capsid protein [Chthoniobacteraceae bacterium]
MNHLLEFRRALDIAKSGIDVENRTASLSFSSEKPVKRTYPLDYPNKDLAGKTLYEVLDHSEGAVDLSRLRDKGPFLVDHDPKTQIGVVDQVSIANRRGLAVVRFGNSPRAQYEFKDVADGVRSGISVGYTIQNYTIAGNVLTATKWRPHEISLLSIGADESVGIGRSARTHEAALTRGNVRGHAKRPAGFLTRGPNPSHLREYSLCRAFVDAARNDGRPKGFEAEIDQEIKRDLGNRALHLPPVGGFLVPSVVFIRDLTAAVAAAAGVGIETEIGSLVPFLRHKSVCLSLGAQSCSGLVGDLALPRQTGTVTASWLGETDAQGESDQAFNQLGLSPKRICTRTTYSRQLLEQTNGIIEKYVQWDLLDAIGVAIDAAALTGTGNQNEPTGILNTSGIASLTFGGSANWASVVSFENKVANNDADIGSLAYAMSPACKNSFKTALRTPTYGNGFLWNPDDNTVNGYPALASNQLSATNQVIFGNWADLIIAGWGEFFDVIVDPFSLATTGQIRVVVNCFVDVGARHGSSFCASSDAGNQ